jgi:hypothetical protein
VRGQQAESPFADLAVHLVHPVEPDEDRLDEPETAPEEQVASEGRDPREPDRVPQAP